jgi:hypothetical protein
MARSHFGLRYSEQKEKPIGEAQAKGLSATRYE